MSTNLHRQFADFTRNNILNTFAQIFEKKGLEKVSVSELCSLCGISRPVFYKYFDDKYQVLETIEILVRDDLAEINKDMPNVPYDRTWKYFPFFLESAEYVDAHRNFIRPLICTPGDNHFIMIWKKLLQKHIRERLENDHFAIPENELYTYSMATEVIGIYEYWLQYAPDLTPEEVAKAASIIVWGPFYDFVQ